LINNCDTTVAIVESEKTVYNEHIIQKNTWIAAGSLNGLMILKWNAGIEELF
jgi:hypothetical protein